MIRVSGQVRSGSETGSTSSWNGLYRPIGIWEPFWGFHTGWPAGAGTEGVRILLAEEAV
ncbi:hypothetical protein GCM10023215_49710 [Pseudonocardia yuanmonensis]|uniref:Uncharacterized protein n=1 Tax=Pseudonocardia yuanmonensis TaxID=1095914 RepID=A0ABP8XEA0_9PSEU